jgi:hypothetical protein
MHFESQALVSQREIEVARKNLVRGSVCASVCGALCGGMVLTGHAIRIRAGPFQTMCLGNGRCAARVDTAGEPIRRARACATGNGQPVSQRRTLPQGNSGFTMVQTRGGPPGPP